MVLLQIFSWFWQWINFEIRLIFDKVTAHKNIVPNFLGHPVYIYASIVQPNFEYTSTVRNPGLKRCFRYYYFAPTWNAKYCRPNEFVGVSASLSARITRKPQGQTSPFLRVACGPHSMLFWQHCDMLYTSGFADYVVIFDYDYGLMARLVLILSCDKTQQT